MTLFKDIALLITALLTMFFVAIRLTECIYELRKRPDMDTFQELVQVIKNFFTIEKYDKVTPNL